MHLPHTAAIINNRYSEEEFSLLFNVEHSRKRKIRLHKVHLPERKIVDAAFSKTHSIVVFSGILKRMLYVINKLWVNFRKSSLYLGLGTF